MKVSGREFIDKFVKKCRGGDDRACKVIKHRIDVLKSRLRSFEYGSLAMFIAIITSPLVSIHILILALLASVGLLGTVFIEREISKILEKLGNPIMSTSIFWIITIIVTGVAALIIHLFFL